MWHVPPQPGTAPRQRLASVLVRGFMMLESRDLVLLVWRLPREAPGWHRMPDIARLILAQLWLSWRQQSGQWWKPVGSLSSRRGLDLALGNMTRRFVSGFWPQVVRFKRVSG